MDSNETVSDLDSSKDRLSPNTVSDFTTSGVNGDNDMHVDEASTEDKEVENEMSTKPDENDTDKNSTTSRKRKIDDLDTSNLSDSSPTEFLGFPDTKAEEGLLRTLHHEYSIYYYYYICIYTVKIISTFNL